MTEPILELEIEKYITALDKAKTEYSHELAKKDDEITALKKEIERLQKQTPQ